jgi:hypothetical protein
MSCLALPSLHSSTFLAHHSAAVASPQVTPWRGILAVEPDVAVLHAGSLLLTRANYCVTPVTGERELFTLRGSKPLALAILSDHLGQHQLRTVALTVRKQWPRTRILILGQSALGLEDYLYDEQIHRSSDPKQVLADLESLYQGMWNQLSNTLDWSVTGSPRYVARPRPSESDPTKIVAGASLQYLSPRDTPSDLHMRG